MAKGSSPNTEEMIKEGALKHQEIRRNMVRKIWVNTIGFLSLEFSELCLTVGTKIITLSETVLNEHRGNI